MAMTIGLVQALITNPIDGGTAQACVFVGPSPVNVEVLGLRRLASDPPVMAAFKGSMLDALAQALASRREVVVGHDDLDSSIYSVELR